MLEFFIILSSTAFERHQVWIVPWVHFNKVSSNHSTKPSILQFNHSYLHMLQMSSQYILCPDLISPDWTRRVAPDSRDHNKHCDTLSAPPWYHGLLWLMLPDQLHVWGRCRWIWNGLILPRLIAIWTHRHLECCCVVMALCRNVVVWEWHYVVCCFCKWQNVLRRTVGQPTAAAKYSSFTHNWISHS